MNPYLSILSIFLLVGVAIPAYAQLSDNVVINEVDLNPPGDDSKSISEWVELYNPTDSEIDIGGWEIASTTALKKTLTIAPGETIGPDQFKRYSYQSLWFVDSADSIELRNSDGAVIDKTPALTDIQNDFNSWQRIYDGYDMDSADDWKFATSTVGSSNGKLVETQEDPELAVTVTTEKPSYLFGETVIISGSVSEKVFILKPYFQPEQITIRVIGPNYDKTITAYPDLNQNYETKLSLQQVLGINEGTYGVSVSYADAVADTSFSVGFESAEQEEKQEGTINISTDQSQYIPGQTVAITATASEIIPFEGMKFIVINPDGEQIYDGTLFPTNGEFTTSIFVTSVNPSLGIYAIHAEYSGKSALSTFEVVEDFKEDVPISLRSDKPAYGIGETVEITGRLNRVWIGTLDLEITQTKQTSILDSAAGSDSGFKILDSIQIMGDGSFSYSFKIPENDARLGDYRINVSKDVGSASIVIHAVEDPEGFAASTDPLTIESDKEVYDLGETIILSGFVQNPYETTGYNEGSAVNISILHEDGGSLEITGLPERRKSPAAGGMVIGYDFTAIIESSGSYSVEIPVTKTVFSTGNYVAKATYLNDHTAFAPFEVVNSLDLIYGPVVSTDKKVYGLGETVHLTGVWPPTHANNVEISITRPDGTVTDSATVIENQRFSWSWNTPVSEAYRTLKTDGNRDISNSNFGVYKIKVSTDSDTLNVFFKVSEDPENDSLSSTPLFVSPEKSLYKAGEKLRILGSAVLRPQGDEGLVVPERVQIQVTEGKFPYKVIHEASVYPDQGGEFSSLFELPATVFGEGSYIVKASYAHAKAKAEFTVANDFVVGIDAPVSLLLSTDKEEYHPGDTVVITGKPNKLIYLEKFDVSVIQQTDTEITCGTFICGAHTGPVTTIKPGPSGSFTHEYVIADSESSVGSYEVTVDADFEIKSIPFDVVAAPYTPKLDTVLEKENRITDTVIPILVEEKTTDDGTIAPRVITGSLITPSRADEPDVNLMVSSATGTCIVGSDEGCLVRESTRKPGQIYDIVEVDGISLKVRYSGPDVRLEKFSILPESDSAYLPDASWNVEVIKDDQPSRFYYKITYKILE